MAQTTQRVFRLSEADMKRLDDIVSGLACLENEGIYGINRTLVIRALIMLGSELNQDQLEKYIKEAKIYI